jgi:hypothetical protein
MEFCSAWLKPCGLLGRSMVLLMANLLPTLPQPPGANGPAPFNLVSREVIEVQRVPPGLQPVLFMDEAMEEYVSDGNDLLHNKWTIYFHVGCTSVRGTAAATVLNPLIDLLQATLAPGDGNALGLGDIITTAQFTGLVSQELGQQFPGL